MSSIKSIFRPSILRNFRSFSTDQTQNSWIFSKEAASNKAHSSLLSSQNEVYEAVSVTVNPGHWDKYLIHSEKMFDAMNKISQNKAEHIASLTYIMGDVNFKALHLIKYPDGWSDIDETKKALKQSAEFQSEYKAGLPLILNQSNEILKGFTFWPSPDKRSGNNVYDVRSYTIKPGSLYDWGNYWAKGIQCRMQVRPDIPYGGFFTQLGQLHTIYHIWCYQGLSDRKLCREQTWNQSEWNYVVGQTVPLIRNMSTRILEPLPFSPTQ